MAQTAYLKPIDMLLPPYGAFEIHHTMFAFEEATPQLLAQVMNNFMLIQANGITNWWIVRDIQYQAVYVPQPVGAMQYSALVHAIRAEKV